MDSARPQSDTRNIPHMQLFHHLKQKFPDLKDNDVNESIQKYGLDRERCEEELSQKTKLHHGGYYGPWGRSRSSSALSSPAMSRVTSPIRSGVPSPPSGVPSTPTTPVLTATSPSALPVTHSAATHHVFGPLYSSGYLVYSYSPGTMVGGGAEPVYTSPTTTAAVAASPIFYQPAVNSPVTYGWHPSVSNGFHGPNVQFLPARQVQGAFSRQDSPHSSREASKSRSSTPVLPKSAPVVPNSFDPFSDFEQKGPPERRKSAETHYDARIGQQYNISDMEPHYEQIEHRQFHSPTPPPNAMDSPSTLTATTTTTLTTSISSCTSPTTVNGSSSSCRPPPALVAEQLSRKNRLEAEVARQVEEKGRLEREVEMMMQELQAREHQRKITADTNTMRIEEVQKENQRLQSECYEMENKILRLAPDVEPAAEVGLPSAQPYPDASQPPPLPRASSGSSLGSATSLTPQTPNIPQQQHHHPGSYVPIRPAPPPPLPASSTHHNSHHHSQGVGGDSTDETGHKWGCSKCTFINHPDMNKCEICDYPRFTIGELQDIHIQVRHQNYHTSRSQEYPGWAMV